MKRFLQKFSSTITAFLNSIAEARAATVLARMHKYEEANKIMVKN